MPPTVSFLRGHIDRITKGHRQAGRHKPRPAAPVAPVSPAAKARSRALAKQITAILAPPRSRKGRS
jgi:hypothetical protein